MDVREKLVEQLREVSDLTPPICEYQEPEEIELFGKRVTVYCKPFEQFQELLREAADYIAHGVTVQECARPLEEWGEDYGDVLWWKFPIEEPPYVGSPLDEKWPAYHTHWTPIILPQPPKGE